VAAGAVAQPTAGLDDAGAPRLQPGGHRGALGADPRDPAGGAVRGGDRLVGAGSGPLDPRLACRVMDVKNFDRVVGDAIEDAVRIAPDGENANAGPLGRSACAFRPSPDPGNDSADASFYRRCHRRVIVAQVGGDLVEVSKRVFGPEDLHAPRNLARTASTSSSVAKRPSSAARSPRSIPASSAGVGS